MQEILRKRLTRLDSQNDHLTEVERNFLLLDGHKKTLFSQLFLKAPGKTVMDRESYVYASEDWINFTKGLAEAESKKNFEERKWFIRTKAFDADYLEVKQTEQVVRRSVI